MIYIGNTCYLELDDVVPGDGTGLFIDRGLRFWLKDGEYHKDDEPAVTFKAEKEEWFQNGFYHKEDGPALINKRRGYGEWWKNGVFIKREEL